jgi:hypothetical protein
MGSDPLSWLANDALKGLCHSIAVCAANNVPRDMKIVFYALVALALFTGDATAADAVFPVGSSVGLVPPQGMPPATAFWGFQDPINKAQIAIAVFPPNAYRDLVTEYSDDKRLAEQRITLQRRENLTVQGNPALLVMGRQQFPAGPKQAGTFPMRIGVIVANSPTATALVLAQYTDEAAMAYPDDVIRAALTSVVFRPPLTGAEQAAGLRYTVSELSGFRIQTVLAGRILMLTDGPKDVDPNSEQSLIIVTIVEVPAPTDRDAFARRVFLEDGRSSIESARNTVVGVLPAHEILGRKQSLKGVSLRVAEWMIFGPGFTLRLDATTRPEKFDQVFPHFVAIRDGIHLR